MKKVIYTSSLLLTELILVSPVFAQATGGDVTQIQSFIKSVIQARVSHIDVI